MPARAVDVPAPEGPVSSVRVPCSAWTMAIRCCRISGRSSHAGAWGSSLKSSCKLLVLRLVFYIDFACHKLNPITL